jgi:hypothetical protein
VNPTIAESIRQFTKRAELAVPDMPDSPPMALLGTMLSSWAALVAPKPLVVLFDEVDTLTGEAMLNFLAQLRGGYADRGVGKFPVSIALVGLRDLRDYLIKLKGGVEPNPGSPFNIKEDSAILGNFDKDDIAALFAQRTAETGQKITRQALDYVWEQSRG